MSTDLRAAVELACEPTDGGIQLLSERLEIRSGEAVDLILGYRRCKDFDTGNYPGQDYAALRGDRTHIVGIVADGVSQSFFGHLAAQCLGHEMLALLWEHRTSPPNAPAVDQHLRGVAAALAPQVDSWRLPATIPTMQRQALEKARIKGSQAVLSAYVLDLVQSRATLYQIGDVTAVVLHRDKTLEVVKADPKGRWATTGRADHKLAISVFSSVAGLLLKSDGAPDGLGKTLPDRRLLESMSDWADRAAENDDVSFVMTVPAEGERLGKPPSKPRPPQPLSTPDRFRPARELLTRALEHISNWVAGLPDTRENPTLLLSHAIQAGDLDQARARMKSRHVDLGAPVCAGVPPVIYAIRQKNVPLLQALLSQGASGNVVDDQGVPALVTAVRHGFSAGIKLLIDNGANVDARSPTGETALLVATRVKDEPAARYLLRWNANPNLCDREAETPLTIGVANGAVGIVEALLRSRRTRLEYVTAAGETATTLATRVGDRAMIQLLIGYRMLP